MQRTYLYGIILADIFYPRREPYGVEISRLKGGIPDILLHKGENDICSRFHLSAGRFAEKVCFKIICDIWKKQYIINGTYNHEVFLLYFLVSTQIKRVLIRLKKHSE